MAGHPALRRGPASTRASGYILEIQALRSVTALLVAVYHIWFNRSRAASTPSS
ncbi:hypothetical protein [Pseudoroseicyclus aestuarii]|uniref:Uncharacterized protein n=1 Tax=Pseudoroseicyclus aestuarii TaxID=1795041 RepID=A0A318SNQ2_9RHOB|nr:hypothetical protein [Pseudoroseicyclus aestuarii]PYE82235.1 hypothetical protein DFP88_10575 [Pseudoroseicyclus aestuarii]